MIIDNHDNNKDDDNDNDDDDDNDGWRKWVHSLAFNLSPIGPFPPSQLLIDFRHYPDNHQSSWFKSDDNFLLHHAKRDTAPTYTITLGGILLKTFEKESFIHSFLRIWTNWIMERVSNRINWPFPEWGLFIAPELLSDKKATMRKIFMFSDLFCDHQSSFILTMIAIKSVKFAPSIPFILRQSSCQISFQMAFLP